MLVAHGTNDRRELRDFCFGKPGGPLVEQDEARFGRERAGNAEPALIAVSE